MALWLARAVPASAAAAAGGAGAALGRAAAPDAVGARALAGGDDLCGLCRAVAGGDRLPAGHLPGGRRVRRRHRRAHRAGRSRQHGRQPGLGPAAACRRAADAAAGRRLRHDGPGRGGGLRRRRRRGPAAGAALRGGAGVLGGRRPDPGDAVRAGRAPGAQRADAVQHRRLDAAVVGPRPVCRPAAGGLGGQPQRRLAMDLGGHRGVLTARSAAGGAHRRAAARAHRGAAMPDNR